MKIVLLSGPGESRKRAEVLKTRNKYDPAAVITLDFKLKDPAVLENAIKSIPLFNTGDRLIVVENISDEFDLTSLPKGEDSLGLLLVANESKESSPLCSSAKKLLVKHLVFMGDKELTAFPFLDLLIEQKATALVELNKLLAEYGGVYVLSMIYYLLRRNILPLPKSDFARKKIDQQKKLYPKWAWAEFYQLALETEYKIKTGLISEELGLTLLVEQWRLGRYGTEKR